MLSLSTSASNASITLDGLSSTYIHYNVEIISSDVSMANYGYAMYSLTFGCDATMRVSKFKVVPLDNGLSGGSISASITQSDTSLPVINLYGTSLHATVNWNLVIEKSSLIYYAG